MKITIDDLMVPAGCAPGPGQVSAHQQATAYKPAVKTSPDLTRIMALPRREQPTEDKCEALIQYMTAKLSRPNDRCECANICKAAHRTPGCITELNASQAWTLYEAAVYGGILGGIGVGHGKTLLDILIAMVMKDCSTVLLLVPPKLVDQLVLEYRLVSQHFDVPHLKIHAGVKSKGCSTNERRPYLHVMPYSRLSRETAADFIKSLSPDLIISDECHTLKDPANSTRAARVERYFKTYPETKGAMWTGSITDDSLNNYAHLAGFCLKDGSPLPRDPHVVDDWARAIDPSDWPAPMGALAKLCEPGEHVHSGFHRRLSETPGVILTRKAAIKAPMVITERTPPPMPDVVTEALESVRGFLRPDGEELVEAWEVARCAREVACGFHYYWDFENGETDEEVAKWRAVRKEWNQELRTKIAPRAEFMDSPLLCQRAAERFASGLDPSMCMSCEGSGKVADPEDETCQIRCHECGGRGKVPARPVWESECWAPWKAIKGTVTPITKTARLSDYLVLDAIEWGQKNKGVIWYSYNALGEWISELGGFSLHGGGPKAAALIAAEDGTQSIVASIQAHGTGRDGLQRLFDRQLICNPPSSSTTWEQLLGRLHRQGQAADKVFAEVYLHTPEFKASLTKAMTRSLYVQTTLGSEQKLQTAMGDK